MTVCQRPANGAKEFGALPSTFAPLHLKTRLQNPRQMKGRVTIRRATFGFVAVLMIVPAVLLTEVAVWSGENRVDRHGDPLPLGAVSRLGTIRWRHEGDAGALAFSADGKTLAVLCREDGLIYFFDAATGKV